MYNNMLTELANDYFNNAIYYAQKNKYLKACLLLKTAIKLQPNSWEVYNLLGLCNYELGRFEISKEFWEKSVLIKSNENEANKYIRYLNSEEFLVVCNKYNEAYEVANRGKFKKAISILRNKKMKKYDNILFLNLLGLCYYGIGKKNTAIKIWTKVLQKGHENKDAIRYLRKTLTEVKKYKVVWMKFLKMFKLN